MKTAGQAILEIQSILGIPESKRFPSIGPLTKQALSVLEQSGKNDPWPPQAIESKGDGTWPWRVEIVGPDLVVRGAKVTWFGGNNDPMDSGQTSSGCATKNRPTLIGASLPMNYKGSHAPTRKALEGSPIPMMPFGLDSRCNPRHDGVSVEVTYLKTGQKLIAPVIDLGPAKWTGNALDLTQAAFKMFAPLSTGKIVCDFRIINGAKFVK